MKKLGFVFVLAALALSACDPASTEARFGEGGAFTVQTAQGPVHYRSTNDYVFQKIFSVLASPGGLRAFMSNTTSVAWNEYHGTQIEYLAADGSTYLWYPGNAVALPGKWEIRKAEHGPSICFLYGPNTFNPVTGSTGSEWDCTPQAMYLFYKTSVVKGDIFHLSSGKVPFALPRRANLSLEEAAARAGVSGPFTNKVDWGAMLAADKAASAK
ncbi:MAG: hypothetical protein HZT43_09625 [Exiguobacterium profundum]|nr:MAG: hypothetical protein HZT43_09625 [Exiguobacterium profundum]